MALATALLYVQTLHAANELLVDRRTLQRNDLVTITVALEGTFANDDVRVPVRNLQIVSDLGQSTDISVTNAGFLRRRIYRFLAKPIAPGPALVGPLTVSSIDGHRETLAPVSLQVLPDVTSSSNDPSVLLHELVATNRPPVFLVAEMDKQEAFIGEQVVVTWWVYNAIDVRELQLGDLPKLDDFWTDDLDVRAASPEQVLIGDEMVVKTPVRRVVLYPLHAGDLDVPGLTVQAEVLRRMRGDSYGGYEGSVVDVTYTSASLVLHAKALPEGTRADAVGELFLSCGKPAQTNGGPVTMEVALSGRGNVRAAARPRFDAPVAGAVEVEEGRVSTARTDDGVASSRRWKVLFFPEKAGTLAIPSMSLDVFVPSLAQSRTLRCTAQTFEAATATPQEHDAPGIAHRIDRRTWLPWVLGATILVLFAIIALPRVRRAFVVRRGIAQLVRDRTPAEIREAVDARFRNLRDEASPRGDTYRALRALLLASERDRVVAEESGAEIRQRIRDLLV